MRMMKLAWIMMVPFLLGSASADRSLFYWQADFDSEGASEDEAKKKITTILGDGVKGIKKQAIAAFDAREAAAGKAPATGDKDDDDDD